ncbi:hypothetical protein Tco_1483653 [Tanacetum coccineum]
MDLDHALRIDPPAALTAESTADQKRAYEQWERSNLVSKVDRLECAYIVYPILPAIPNQSQIIWEVGYPGFSD